MKIQELTNDDLKNFFPISFSKILQFWISDPSLVSPRRPHIPPGRPQKTAKSTFFSFFCELFFDLILRHVLRGKNHKNGAPNPSNNSVFSYFFVYQFRRRIFEGEKRENQCFVQTICSFSRIQGCPKTHPKPSKSSEISEKHYNENLVIFLHRHFIDFSYIWAPQLVQNSIKLQEGRPSGRFFSCHTFLSDDLVHLGRKMVPQITPQSKKLCISNPKMQENLIVFFVIDSGRMLVERNYAICQARVHRQRGTEVAVPTACQTPSFLTNFVFKLSQILDLRL